MEKWILMLVLGIISLSFIYASCSSEQIDINSASAEELDKITYVGDCVSDGIASLSTGFAFIGLITQYSFSHEYKMYDFVVNNMKMAKHAFSHQCLVCLYK